MRILYIGQSDRFASSLIDKYSKEGNSISIISSNVFTKEVEPKLNFNHYQFNANSTKIDKIFNSVKPEVIVFGGELLGVYEWTYTDETNSYLSTLLNVLNTCANYKVKKILYLSSIEVYKNLNSHLISEDGGEISPSTYKGLLCAQGETLVHNFCFLQNIEYVLLRFGNLYGNKINDSKNDFLSELVYKINTSSSIEVNINKYYTPLSLNDAAEAVYRATLNTSYNIYNVTSLEHFNEYELYEKIKSILNKHTKLIPVHGEQYNYNIDCTRIKVDLEWFAIRKFIEALLVLSIKLKIAKRVKKSVVNLKPFFSNGIVKTLENFIAFVFFVIFFMIFKDHNVLRNVDVMNIYIILMGLFSGIKQSILAVILAFSFYLYTLQYDISNLLNILINADTFLKLAQYIFTGIVVGYVVDQYKVNLDKVEIEKDYLLNEYNELKDINNQNIILKHQYEKRLLSYKTSLPKLYTITSQLNSLDPEIIFSSIVKIIQDVMETSTVAIYNFSSNTGYARLNCSLNEHSIFLGYSFKLSECKALEEKMLDNEIFIGNQWIENSPSIASPIFHKGEIIALIVIKEMPFEGLNLYQINLFRTLTALINASFIKAYQYEEKIRSEKYIADTAIMNYTSFKNLLHIKINDRNNNLSVFTLLRIVYKGNPIEYYHHIANSFRATDYFGVDSSDTLHVLLSNSNSEASKLVALRLLDKSIEFEVVTPDGF